MENEQTTIENILHVFDLINDNVINAKIGKKVAEIIAETGETAEHVIKTVGLKHQDKYFGPPPRLVEPQLYDANTVKVIQTSKPQGLALALKYLMSK